MRSFFPCHVHSDYSLLEGVDGVEALLTHAQQRGYAALALTDVNNLYGAVPFVQAAKRYTVRPILGACLRQGKNRCTVLIAEAGGYGNLCRILSRLHLQKDPQLIPLLRENHDGLQVLADDPADLEALREPFGNRLWAEVIRPNAVNRERRLLEAARRLGIKLVASVAAHFAEPKGYDTFRLLTAARNGSLLDRMPTDLSLGADHSLADVETMHHRFRDLPEAIVNGQRLAEECRSDVLPRGVILPPPKLSAGIEPAAYLRTLCLNGLVKRYGAIDAPARAGQEAPQDRLERELTVVNLKDLAGYFLVVHDIAMEARRRNLSMALRGSAGNSLICFLLEITDVDPLRFDLPMERFLHAGREDLPDIDLDFDWKQRDEIIQTVFDRYGNDHVAMISSHLFLQPKSAFREAGKVHGLSNEQISRLLENLADRVDDLVTPAGLPENALYARAPRSFPLEPERWPRILANAQRLLGRPHHLSVHPGGVVITPQPIEGYVPLQRAAKGVVITHFDKDGAEHVGLVKIDLLGNRALATVDEARRGCADLVSTAALPDVHPAAVAMLRAGDTLGVNQLESPAMRHLLIQMQPRGLMDVIQSLALVRPGAATIGAKERFIRRRRGIDPLEYEDPRLEPLLQETCGLMVYEDDALRVVQALTGFDGPTADRFRKQVTKRTSDEEERQLAQTFLDACMHNGVTREAAGLVWIQLAKFNNYSFCKSHSVSYGLIAWQAVLLKVEQPLCFWVAALNNNQGMYPRRTYVEAIKRAGIPLRLPCINRSEMVFTREGEGIRVGLGLIDGLEEAALNKLIEERQRRGPFASLAECRRRIPLPPELLARLIQVGAFDFTRKSRPELVLEAELDGPKLVQTRTKQAAQPKQPVQEAALFPANVSFLADCGWAPVDYSTVQRWQEEYRLLNFLVGPPLMQLYRSLVPQGLHDSRCLGTHLGKRVRMAGLVVTARQTPTSQGKPMQFITLEDEWGLAEVTIFPGACPLVPYLRLGPYVVEGRVEEQYGVRTLNADKFELT